MAYAIGAGSNLLRSTQEQTYLSYLMSFAACLDYSFYEDGVEGHCHQATGTTNWAPPTSRLSGTIVATLLLLRTMMRLL